MENRIKECQIDLFADRTSTHTMAANQLRLWFAGLLRWRTFSSTACAVWPCRRPISLNGGYLALRDQVRDQSIVAVSPMTSSTFLRIAQLNRVDHVAADIPGAAGNQNGHEACSCRASSCPKLIRSNPDISHYQLTEAIPGWGL